MLLIPNAIPPHKQRQTTASYAHRLAMVELAAAADPRFASSALVVNAPHIRFYAGMPLVTEDGFALGTVCVADREPRTLDVAQREALRALARQAMSQLEFRRLRSTQLPPHQGP